MAEIQSNNSNGALVAGGRRDALQVDEQLSRLQAMLVEEVQGLGKSDGDPPGAAPLHLVGRAQRLQDCRQAFALD